MKTIAEKHQLRHLWNLALRPTEMFKQCKKDENNSGNTPKEANKKKKKLNYE
jgi:hypothetical protein